MKKTRIRKLSDTEWSHLLTLAAGYLPLCEGDGREAMARALAAHSDLILAIKQEAITARLPEGEVTMMVPEGGGVALKLTSGSEPE